MCRDSRSSTSPGPIRAALLGAFASIREPSDFVGPAAFSSSLSRPLQGPSRASCGSAGRQAGRQTDKDSRGLARQAASRADTQAVLSRLMPSPQVRSRSVRSSDTRARARVRLVNSRGAPWRHTREGDEKDVWNRAGIEDVIHFARSLDERLPGAVRGGPALVADR